MKSADKRYSISFSMGKARKIRETYSKSQILKMRIIDFNVSRYLTNALTLHTGKMTAQDLRVYDIANFTIDQLETLKGFGKKTTIELVLLMECLGIGQW